MHRRGHPRARSTTLAGNLDQGRGSKTASWSLESRLCHFRPSPTQGSLSLKRKPSPEVPSFVSLGLRVTQSLLPVREHALSPPGPHIMAAGWRRPYPGPLFPKKKKKNSRSRDGRASTWIHYQVHIPRIPCLGLPGLHRDVAFVWRGGRCLPRSQSNQAHGLERRQLLMT